MIPLKSPWTLAFLPISGPIPQRHSSFGLVCLTLEWIVDQRHHALSRFIENGEKPPSLSNRTYFLAYILGKGELQLVKDLLLRGRYTSSDMALALQASSKGGHIEIVDRMLVAKADVNTAAASYSG